MPHAHAPEAPPGVGDVLAEVTLPPVEVAPHVRAGSLPPAVSRPPFPRPHSRPAGPRADAGAMFAANPAGLAELSGLTADLIRAAGAGLGQRSGPVPASTPAAFADQVGADISGLLPEHGCGAAAVIELVERYAAGMVDLSHPTAVAHLQPPALGIAVAAETIAAAFNASVDTWDSGPYAVELERWVIRALAQLVGYGVDASGVFTSGGTASNLQALMLARDAIARERFGVEVAVTGWPPDHQAAVYCSEVAHFSTTHACAVLGVGERAVRPIPVDDKYQMRIDILAAELSKLDVDEVPLAIVATAGTTDFGSIDPLLECAALARQYRTRLHVDAAYGGGAAFSDQLRPLLSGVDSADTITLDLHKIGWQPAAASVLLVRQSSDFGPYQRRIAYLNPEDDGAEGYDGLLGHSLATTRRADALKVAATFLALGRSGLGSLLDACHYLARHAARRIAAHPQLELTAGAALTTVVFRYCCADSDRVNGALRRRLLRSGTALLGRTSVPGRGVHLKLTLLNPETRTHDIDELLETVAEAGREECGC